MYFEFVILFASLLVQQSKGYKALMRTSQL